MMQMGMFIPGVDISGDVSDQPKRCVRLLETAILPSDSNWRMRFPLFRGQFLAQDFFQQLLNGLNVHEYPPCGTALSDYRPW